jgi:phosphate-selective porin OprO/OprP
MTRWWAVRLLLGVAGLAAAGPARAQVSVAPGLLTPSPPPMVSAAETSPPTPRLHVLWQDGLVLETDDGDYRFQFGTFIRLDGRFAGEAPTTGAAPNTLLMRTLRATFQGRLARYITFRLQPDFTGSGPTVADAWVDIQFSEALHVRMGRDKVPIGLEVLLPDANVLFLERGLTVNLLPQRDVGVQAYGTLGRGIVSYAGGLFDGQVDGAANNSNHSDTDNSKDVVGRILIRPFSRISPGALERLNVALAGSTGQQHSAQLPLFVTSVQRPYFAYRAGTLADGNQSRLSPQLSYYYGHAGAYAEYVRSSQWVRFELARGRVRNSAWQAVGSWFLTGEVAGDRVRPTHPFNPDRHQWGALQLTARVGELAVDPLAFSLGAAEADSSLRTQVMTVGANWYLTTNTKMLVNVERSLFARKTPAEPGVEHALLVRMQLNY